MKYFNNLKSRDHMDHYLLDNIFHKYWGYHQCGIMLAGSFSGHVVNMHSRIAPN